MNVEYLTGEFFALFIFFAEAEKLRKYSETRLFYFRRKQKILRVQKIIIQESYNLR